MADIVNLRQWRKRQARSEADEKAAQNRARFGRSKVDKTRRDDTIAKSARLLDQHFLGREPDDCE
jgi:Domain of unknown function (DUF4169)